MSKIINYGDDSRKKLIDGINQLADSVIITLGPNGRNVVIQQDQGVPQSTKDGVTVAKSIELEDQVENVGAQMLKQAAIKTAEQAGDGTTTSTLLAREIVNAASRYSDKGHNIVEIKRGIDKCVKAYVDNLRDQSQDISSEDQLRQVATISANNDTEVGELIATAMEKVGRDGVVTIEESRTGETYLETVEGLQFNPQVLFRADVFRRQLGLLDAPFVIVLGAGVQQRVHCHGPVQSTRWCALLDIQQEFQRALENSHFMRFWHRSVPFEKVHADVEVQRPVRLSRHHSGVHPQHVITLIQNRVIALGLTRDVFQRTTRQRGFIKEGELLINAHGLVDPVPLIAIAV